MNVSLLVNGTKRSREASVSHYLPARISLRPQESLGILLKSTSVCVCQIASTLVERCQTHKKEKEFTLGAGGHAHMSIPQKKNGGNCYLNTVLKQQEASFHPL